jgi:hypothetical protein
MRHTRNDARIWVCLTAAVAVSSAVLLSRAESPKHPAVPKSPTPISTTTTEPAIVAVPFAEAPPVASSDNTAPPIPSGESGMLVGIDPETGRLGKPSAEFRSQMEAAAGLAPALDRSMDGIEIIHNPDGSMMADLKGRFQDYTIIRVTPDGRKIESCVQGPQVEAALQAEDASAPAPVSAPAPAPAPAPEHEVR